MEKIPHSIITSYNYMKFRENGNLSKTENFSWYIEILSQQVPQYQHFWSNKNEQVLSSIYLINNTVSHIY